MYTIIQAVFSDVDSAEAAVRALKENNIEIAARRIMPSGGGRRYDTEFASLFGVGYANYQSGADGGQTAGNASGIPPAATPLFALGASNPGKNAGADSEEVILKVKINESMADTASGILINRHGRKVKITK